MGQNINEMEICEIIYNSIHGSKFISFEEFKEFEEKDVEVNGVKYGEIFSRYMKAAYAIKSIVDARENKLQYALEGLKSNTNTDRCLERDRSITCRNSCNHQGCATGNDCFQSFR